MAAVELGDLPSLPDTESRPGGMKTLRCRTSALAGPAMYRVSECKVFLIIFYREGGEGGGAEIK